MWIHVVCGAGASSMFIAQRLKRAGGAELSIRTSAGSLSGTGVLDSDPDVILLGAHLAAHRDELASRFERTPVIVLPEDAGQDFDGQRTLALVRRHLDSEAGSNAVNPTEGLS